MGRNRKYTDEQFAKVQELVDGGSTVSAALQSTGVPAQSWYQFKRKQKSPDPTPGGAKTTRKVKAPSPQASDEQLVKMLTVVAVAPAVPAATILHCDYCTMHFVTQGPQSAVKLVELSRDHPALRQVLQGIHGYWEQAAWATLLASYVGIPMAHHLAPDFLYKWFVMFANMPERRSVQHRHEHAQENTVPSDVQEMSTDDLMAAVQAMGATFDVRDTVSDDAEIDTTDTPEAEPDAADTAETGVEAVTVDPDAVIPAA